jgi:glycerol-3-phosphate dehydrogenase
VGGILHYQVQIHNPARLALAFIQSAARMGADVLNYAQIGGFIEYNGAVAGAKVCDQLSGEMYDIHARLVIQTGQTETRHLAKGVNIVTRALFQHHAALRLYTDASQPVLMSPWRGHTLIGTVYRPPEPLHAVLADIEPLIARANRAYPAAKLSRESVSAVQSSLLPVAGVEQPRILSHRQHGVKGLLNVEGGTVATARHLAEQVVDAVFAQWDKQPPRSISAITPLDNGQIESFDQFLAAEVNAARRWLDEEQARHLIYNYGCAARKVLDYLNGAAEQGAVQPHDVLKAEIRHAIYKEMAVKLSDVVFRRTELASTVRPAAATLHFAADIMAEALGWSPSRKAREVDEINAMYRWAHEPGSSSV